MSVSKRVIVTGANRGIGLAICQFITSQPALGSIQLVATTRRGDDLKLSAAQKGCEVSYAALDIGSPESIEAFAKHLALKHDGADILINNAGINLDSEDNDDAVKRTLDINYRGTLQMCESLLPLLQSSSPRHDSRSSPRIVNISSVASSLRPYSTEIAARFRSIASQGSLQDLDTLANEYQSLSPSPDFAEPPRRSYAVSKACVNAFTSILARHHPDVLINACCPGWIATDMGKLISRRGTVPPKTPAEGAEVPLHLAFGDIKGITGKYWANETVRSKGLPAVREW